MGCWAELGWAWNLRPAGSPAVTGEFVESALIFTYGSTNVFLEHLAGWGKAWTAQDLEHVSISVMFFGAGLVSFLQVFTISLYLTNISAAYYSNQNGSGAG